MNQQMQMALGPLMEQTVTMDFAHKVIDKCWDHCYDKQLLKEDLSKSAVSAEQSKKMAKCQHKCVARHFEVMKLINKSREQREKEAAMGLPPGSLNEA